MTHENHGIPICGLALSSLLSMGCFVGLADGGNETSPPAPTGSLTVLWTVANRSDPRACSLYGREATEFELLLYRDGMHDTQHTSEEYAPCEDFQLTVDLTPGNYTGLTTLVDSTNRPVTTSLPLRDLKIIKGATLTVDVDFPSGSFL